MGSVGLVYFGVFAAEVNPDAGTPAAVAFTAVGLLLSLTALATLPGLWRGRRTAWHILTCYLIANIYFSLYKILVEGETESVTFLVADLVVVGLLLLSTTRRYFRN